MTMGSPFGSANDTDGIPNSRITANTTTTETITPTALKSFFIIAASIKTFPALIISIPKELIFFDNYLMFTFIKGSLL
jgi:hypothetical protein